MVIAEDLEQTRVKTEPETPAPVLPDAVQEALNRLLSPEETVAAFLECDLLPEGAFGKCWLFGTARRIGLYVPGGSRELAVDIPLDQVEKLERQDLHGVTVIEAITTDRAIVAARMTPARLDDLGAALPEIQKLVPGTHPEQRPHWRRKKENSKVCPTCGNPLPPWNGVCVDCLEKRKLLFRLLGRVKSYWPLVTLGLVLMLTIQISNLAGPLLNRMLIDRAIGGRHLNILWIVLGIMILLSVISQALGAFRQYLMAWFGQKVIYDLRAELYNHLQRLSIAFYDSKQTGWIMDRITSDTSNLQDFLTDALQDFVMACMSLVGIAAVMFYMNWRLALLTLVPTPFIGYASYVLMKKSYRLWHRVWRKRSRISSLLSDVVPGVRVVKAFVGENREARRFSERNSEFMNASVSASRTFAWFGPITGILALVGTMIVWGQGGYQAITQPKIFTVGTLVAFIQYVGQFYNPVQTLSRMTQRFQQSATSAQRVFEVLDTPPDVRDMEAARVLPPIVGRVEFDDVTFGYEPHLEVLKGVSFVVEPGEMVGLVGPSGAGKSTSINLLCRFYDVLDGAIRIDGIDIRDVTLQSLREQIGVVLQEPFLFHGTLFDNIAYGRPDATRREVLEAAKAANCHEFVLRFPDGYDTIVGERGTRLSGGERQRISIARAILKNPRILILDEATSSVDTETEGQIRQALDRLVRGRTTIAIAHRFSTLRHADRLVVLEKGKLAECGTHAELLAKEGGIFRKLSDQQTQLAQIIAISG